MSLLAYAARKSATRYINTTNITTTTTTTTKFSRLSSCITTTPLAPRSGTPLTSGSATSCTTTIFQQPAHRSFHETNSRTNAIVSSGAATTRVWKYLTSAFARLFPGPINPFAWSPSFGLYGYKLRMPSDLIQFERELRTKCDSLLKSINSTPVSLRHLTHIDLIFNAINILQSLAELITQTHPNQEWRDVGANTSESLTEYIQQLDHSPILYESLNKLCSHPDFSSWSEEIQRVAKGYQCAMDLHGVGSSEHDRQLIRDAFNVIHRSQANFASARTNEDSELRWLDVPLDEADHCHLPPEFRGGFIKVQVASAPVFFSLMPIEKCRRSIYIQYNSEETIGQQGHALIELIQARLRLARLLGVSSYAEHKVAGNIACETSHVRKLLVNLLESLQPEVNEKTKQEVMNMKFEKWIHEKEMKLTAATAAVTSATATTDVTTATAATATTSSSPSPPSPSISSLPYSFTSLTPDQLAEVNSTPVYEWDIAFYNARVCNRASSSVKKEEGAQFAQHFTLRNVIEGWTILCDKLFGLTLQRVGIRPGETPFATAERHGEVYKLELWEKTKPLGIIYLDLYARTNKGSSTGAITIRCGVGGAEAMKQLPVTTVLSSMPRTMRYDQVHPQQIVWNNNIAITTTTISSAPSSPSQSHITQFLSFFDLHEVELLFHEFGHCLQNIFSSTKFYSSNGMVAPLDFIELPSTLFECFLEDPSFIQMWAKHYSTNEPISSSLLQSKFKLKNQFRNVEMIHQCLEALFDQEIYGEKFAQIVEKDELSLKMNHVWHELHQKYSLWNSHSDWTTTQSPSSSSSSDQTELIRATSPYLRPSQSTAYYGGSVYCYIYCRLFAKYIMKESGVIGGSSNGDDANNFDTRYKKLGQKLRYQYLTHGISKSPHTILTDLVGLNESNLPTSNMSEADMEQQMKALHIFVEQQAEQFAKVL